MLNRNFAITALCGLTSLWAIPSHAILRVLTQNRSNFYVYRAKESGQLRELVFATQAPTIHGPTQSALPMEYRAFHENYIFARAVARIKTANENYIRDTWASYVTLVGQVGTAQATQTTRLVAYKEKLTRLQKIVFDPLLTDAQKQTLETELRTTTSTVKDLENTFPTVEKYKANAIRQEDTYVTSFANRMVKNREVLEKAYDDTKVYWIISNPYDQGDIGLALEEIAVKGYCTKDPNGAEFCDFGAPPSETNAWDKLQTFPKLDLVIDRQGASRP